MYMKKHIVLAIAALVLTCCEGGTAAAQVSYQAGLFGYRTYGQNLTPPRSMFLGGLPTTAIQRFPTTSQSSVGNDFSSPWRQSYQSAIDPTYLVWMPSSSAIQPQLLGVNSLVSQMAISSQQPGGVAPAATAAGTQPPAVRAGLTAASPLPGSNTSVLSATQAKGVAFDAAVGPTWNYAAGSLAKGAVSFRAQSSVRSPELSARLTRIARARGMLAGPGINVYLNGDVAVVQGTVRSTADRTLLCNVLGLEPNISRVDDRLVVRRYYTLRGQ
jgi:hypothetical protein